MKICEKNEHCIECPIFDETAEDCASAIDVEPVIYCKNCEYCVPIENCEHYGSCLLKTHSDYYLVMAEDFCSWGEQK